METPTIEEMLADVEGETTFEEHVLHFQKLIDSGIAWHLEGSVGREAMSLIEDGYCMCGPVGHHDYWGNYVPSRFEVTGFKGSPSYVAKRNPDSPVLTGFIGPLDEP